MNIERLRALYPNLSETELETAQHNLEQFVAFLAEMYESREAKAEQDSATQDFDREKIES